MPDSDGVVVKTNNLTKHFGQIYMAVQETGYYGIDNG